MPRIARNITRFAVDGVDYTATFIHAHGNITDAGRYGQLKLKHVTSCAIDIDKSTYIVGVSRCSIKDQYIWQKGIKRSFEAAIKALGVGFHYDGHRIVYHSDADRIQYGKFMTAFYSEQNKKEYGDGIKKAA